MNPRPPAESEAEDKFREAVEKFIQEHRELRVQLRELQQKFDAAVSAKVPDRKEEIRSMLSYEISQCPECRAWETVCRSTNGKFQQNCARHQYALAQLDKASPSTPDLISRVRQSMGYVKERIGEEIRKPSCSLGQVVMLNNLSFDIEKHFAYLDDFQEG